MAVPERPDPNKIFPGMFFSYEECIQIITDLQDLSDMWRESNEGAYYGQTLRERLLPLRNKHIVEMVQRDIDRL